MNVWFMMAARSRRLPPPSWPGWPECPELQLCERGVEGMSQARRVAADGTAVSQIRPRRSQPFRARSASSDAPPRETASRSDLPLSRVEILKLAIAWFERSNAEKDLVESIYSYGRAGAYDVVMKNLGSLAENGIGGLVGHLRRMQGEAFSDAKHAEDPHTKAQLYGMSDGWADLAERAEAALTRSR